MTKAKFELPAGTRLHITSTTIGREKHGENKVPAFYVDMRWNTSNESLALLDSRLKGTFFQKARNSSDDPAQKEIDMPVSDLPSLRFPDLGEQSWTKELHGYLLKVKGHGEVDIRLSDCTIRKVGFACLEGGSVIVTFQVRSSGVGEHEMGALGVLLDHDVEAQLIAPDEGAQGSLLGEVKPLGDGQVVPIKKVKPEDVKPEKSPIDALAEADAKARALHDAQWPFPKGLDDSKPPSGNVLAEGATPAEAAKITKAKKAEAKRAEV